MTSLLVLNEESVPLLSEFMPREEP